MAKMSGFITLTQEDRFQLAGEDGRKQLFLLSHSAPLDVSDLQRLERGRIRVTVHYRDADGLIAGAAHEIDYADRS